MEANTRELKQKNEEIKESLQKMEGREEMEPDQVVTPTAPLYKQWVVLFVILHKQWVVFCEYSA